MSPLGQHISNEFGLTKRHFFEFPSPHCNVDLDEYEYEGDFEWHQNHIGLVRATSTEHGVKANTKSCYQRIDAEEVDTVMRDGSFVSHMTAFLSFPSSLTDNHALDP